MNYNQSDRRTHAAGDLAAQGGTAFGGAARSMGLSISHISPHVFGRPHSGYWRDGYDQRLREHRRGVVARQSYESERRRVDEAGVTYFEHGNLIKMRTIGTPPLGLPARGKCGAFSHASRRRMLESLQSIDREIVELPIMVTLTYPKEYPDDPRQWKRHLDNFRKRVVRAYPGAWGFWKLEPQKRGAPHFHLLVFGVRRMCKDWLSVAWYEVVGSNDILHLIAGTRVEWVRSWRGVISYAAKYLGKTLDWLPEEWRDGVGRWWGKFNMKAAGEYCKRRGQLLHWRAWLQLRRVLYRRLKKTGRRLRLQTRAGCTFYLPGDWMPKLIVWARGAPGVPRAAPGASVDFVMDGVAPF